MLPVFRCWRWRSAGLRLVKMALGMMTLLLLVQGFENSVSESITKSNACGSDIITYWASSSHELLFINGNLVDRQSFCKVLESLHLYGCTIDRYPGNVNYGLTLSSVGFPFKGGRKILQKDTLKESRLIHHAVQRLPSTHDEHNTNSVTASKNVDMVVPGVLLLCCGLLCPCFCKRQKRTAEIIHARGINLMDSTSSLEMNSASEKVQASPRRVPPSPSRFSVPPSPSRFSMSPKLTRLGSVHLNLNQITRATHNFSKATIIGEGGFGTVYKAQLEDGQVVAVKRAKKEHFGSLRTEFSSEVQLLSKIDHRNLVKLLGYVDKGNELLIITEYVPNGTLRKYLDGQGGKILDFNQRLEIAIDIVHGLTYLHSYAERQIIHRDVKSSNILLTDNLRAKVADFGFARLGPMDSDRTHVSTKVKGTIGYLDPEYMKTYQLTTKSDVYSFGILLLEIFTGRRPVEMNKPTEERVALRWAFKKYSERNVAELVDPLMQEDVDTEILIKIFGLAIQCAAPIRSDRPEMKSVGEQLWAIRADYLKSGKTGQ